MVLLQHKVQKCMLHNCKDMAVDEAKKWLYKAAQASQNKSCAYSKHNIYRQSIREELSVKPLARIYTHKYLRFMRDRPHITQHQISLSNNRRISPHITQHQISSSINMRIIPHITFIHYRMIRGSNRMLSNRISTSTCESFRILLLLKTYCEK